MPVPSAIAVLPTPASPTNSGLFLRRRAENLNDALNFGFAADQRVDLAVLGERVQILGVLLECGRLILAVTFGRLFGPRFGFSSPCPAFVMPCEMKLTTSSRVTPC